VFTRRRPAAGHCHARLPRSWLSADGKAGPPPATTHRQARLPEAGRRLAPAFKKRYVDDVKPKIAALKALPAAKFIKAETDELDKMMLQQQAAITAKQWRQSKLNNGLVLDKILMAQKTAARRNAFDYRAAQGRHRPESAGGARQGDRHAAGGNPAARQDADEIGSKKGMQFEDAKDEILRC
jgi:hypothetical protein